MDIRQYIGIPYQPHGNPPESADCWTFVRWVSDEEFGNPLPEYFYTAETVREFAIDNIVQQRLQLGEVWVEKDKPDEGDVLVFKVKGYDLHVGIYIGNNYFMHSFPGRNSTIEELTDINWRHRLTGIYEHV